MPKFFYKIRTKEGEIKSGIQEAKSDKDLAHVLIEQGYSVISLSESEKKKRKQITFSFGSIPLVEKMVFTKNLSVMIGSGLALSKALNVLAEQTKNEKFKKIIKSISSDIQKGEQLGTSMSKYKSVFPDLYVNMVKVGETAGNLKEVLLSLAEQMKKDHEIISRVKGALMYPGIILTAMLGIGSLMMVIVVPSLAATFNDLGAELPATTQFVISLSDFLVNYWYIALIILIVFAYGLKLALKTESGKKIFDRILLKLPVFGNLSRELNSARFARTFTTLVDAGVPMVDALDIVSSTLTNYFFSESLKKAAKEIQKGRQLNEALKDYDGIYPPLVIQMVEVGEETGALTKVLSELAEFYEEEVDNVTKNMSTIIEPILMVFIGAAVGFFAISMITPMYSMLDSI